jgi:hypothetical protein
MTFVAELALGKGVDVLAKVLTGTARRIWEKGPVGRVLVVLRIEFENESRLNRDDFFAWEQDEEIASLLADLTTGRLLPGPETRRHLAEAFEPKLYRVRHDERAELALRIADAAQQAAPLVSEGGEATLLIANRLDSYMVPLMEQMADIGKLLGTIEGGGGSAERPPDTDESVPVPAQVEDEIAEIAKELLRAPLQRAGKLEAAARANDLLESGDAEGAAKAMRDVAEGLRKAGSLTLAERYRDWAALSLTESGGGDRATELLVEVAIAQALRGSELARNSATRLREVLPKDREWLAAAVEAMAAWPENPRGAVEALLHAVDHCRAEERLQWLAPLIELQVLFGDNEAALEVAVEVGESDLTPGFRIAIELDLIEAEENLGQREAADSRWKRVLSFAESSEDILLQRGLVWQRYTRSLLFRGEFEAAIEAARSAVSGWAEIPGADQQAAEPLLDLQAGALLLGRHPPGWALRGLAIATRGNAETPASLIQQLDTQAVAARIEEKAPEALVAWSMAILIARRAGNFHSEHELSAKLGEFYAHVKLPQQALSYLLFAGKGKQAVEVAGEISGEAIAQLMVFDVPPWQLAAVYQVLAKHGRRIPEAQVDTFAERMFADARERPQGIIAPQPAAGARRAVAQTLLALPERHQDAARTQLRSELENPAGFDSLQAACEALILATNAGILDESEILIDGFLVDAAVRKISSLWVAERLEVREDLRARVREAALGGSYTALEAMVIAGLAAGDAELEARCDEIADKAAERETLKSDRTEDGRVETSIGIGVNFEGSAIIARNAGADARSAYLDRLIVTLAEENQPEINRASAANALFNLAGSIPPEMLGRVIDTLTLLARGDYEISEIDRESAASQHPFSRFRIGLDAPNELRSTALRAWAHVVVKSGETPGKELIEQVELALLSPHPRIQIGALKALVDVTGARPPVTFEHFLRAAEPSLRIAALDALAARGVSFAELDALPQLLHDTAIAVRLNLLFQSKANGPVPSRAVIEQLANDEDAYVRMMAARAIRDFSQDDKPA